MENNTHSAQDATSETSASYDTVTTYETIVEQLQTVFDPEFPLIDIYTMGLIYDIQPNDAEKHIVLTMTFTSPSCPAAELIETMIKNAVSEILPTYTLEIIIVRDPAWTYHMMKDEDLKRMFE